ncbi:unnamed protein product, partial [Rotaria sp. Silwood2]
HKPNVQQQEEGIHKTGGRINTPTHALPDIIPYSKQSSVAYIILACDGIWDVINNQQIATFVFSNKISSNILQDIVSQLLDECLKLETMDNMSVSIVKL